MKKAYKIKQTAFTDDAVSPGQQRSRKCGSTLIFLDLSIIFRVSKAAKLITRAHIKAPTMPMLIMTMKNIVKIGKFSEV